MFDSWVTEVEKYKLPPSYFTENFYFVGTEKKKRLSEEAGLKAIPWLAEDRITGVKGLNKHVFMQDICAVAHAVRNWIESQEADFGGLAKSAAFQRVKTLLWTGRLRAAVQGCLRDGVPLHGNEIKDSGIEMCRNIVADFRAQIKAITSPSPAGTAAAALGGTALGGTASQGATDVVMRVGGEQHGLTGSAELDPCVLAAENKTEANMAKLVFHRGDHEEFISICSDNLLVSKPTWILIDAQTSKLKILLQHIENVATMVRKVQITSGRLIVFAGRRIDVLGAVATKMSTAFSQWSQFTLTLSKNESQRFNEKPCYVLYALSRDTKDNAQFKNLPMVVNALAAKAHKFECIRRRCLDLMCAHRPESERTEIEAKVAKGDVSSLSELHGDDVADLGVDASVEEKTPQEAEEEDVYVPPMDEDEEAGPKSRMILDIFPYGWPKDYYKRIARGISQEPIPQLVGYTTTASPGLPFATIDLEAKGYFFMDRVSEHSFNHGQEILRTGFYENALKQERRHVSADKRKVLLQDLSFIVVPAPSEQAIRFSEVGQDGSTPSWRSTPDIVNHGEAFEKAVSEVLMDDLESCSLAVKPEGLASHLLTTVARREGDDIIDVKHKLFTDIVTLLEFYNTGGNAALLDKPVLKIPGLLDSAGDTSILYAVVLGAASYLTDKRVFAKRTHSNCRFAIRPQCGPNDGFIQLVVDTHNGCGVGAHSVLAADFGERWQASTSGTGTAATRFKSVMNMLLQNAGAEATEASSSKQSVTSQVDEEEVKEPPKKKTKAGQTQAPQTLPTSEAPQADLYSPSQASAELRTDSTGTAAANPTDKSTQQIAKKDTILAEGDKYYVYIPHDMQDTIKVAPSATKTTNTKISPNQLLLKFTQGEVQELENTPIDALRFSFTSTKENVYLATGAKGEM